MGSNLCFDLIRRGVEVVVLDDLSSGADDLLPRGAKLLKGSVTEDADLERAFDHDLDYVFHLAALFANQNSVEHPRTDLLVNGMGTLKVLEKAAAGGVRKVLYGSSSCVYGDAGVMREDQAGGRLDTPYAITKMLGEHYARFWADHHGLDVVIVRLFNSYGPHERPGRYRNVIPNFLALAAAGKALPITGTGEETRDFTYVGDIVTGMIQAVEASTAPGETFNLASGRETRILDLANAINALTGNSAGIQTLPRRSWDHVQRRVGDIGNTSRRIGYFPQVALEEGLELTWAWFKEHGV